jgi:uncharacterized membrane protein
MSTLTKAGSALRKYFISGLLVTVPLIITFLVLRFLFSAVDGLLKPIVHRIFGYDIPGLGAAVTILLILLAGVVAANVAGAALFRLGDRLFGRTPFVRIVYTAARQLVDSLLAPKSRAFSEVVLVEYPRKGIYAMGFRSRETCLRRGDSRQDVALVFLPSTPTPFTGWILFVPRSEVYPLDITIEEGIKILVSGGVVSPDTFDLKNNPVNREVTDASG